MQETGELDLSDFEGDFECLSGTGARVLEVEGLQGSLKESCACKVCGGSVEFCEDIHRRRG